jgi:hypothetical protein
MGPLRLQQTAGVAPRTERARLILPSGLARYLGDFARWHKIANLAQDVEPASGWFDRVFIFQVCRVAGLNRQTYTFWGFSAGWL